MKKHTQNILHMIAMAKMIAECRGEKLKKGKQIIRTPYKQYGQRVNSRAVSKDKGKWFATKMGSSY